jgi:hypothetical protein
VVLDSGVRQNDAASHFLRACQRWGSLTYKPFNRPRHHPPGQFMGGIGFAHAEDEHTVIARVLALYRPDDFAAFSFDDFS